MSLPAELRSRLERIRLLVTDVDGVMTDGSLYFGERGEVVKAFHVRDGLGLKLLMSAGVEVAVASGRASEALASRVAELGIRHFMPGRDDKGQALAELLARLGVAAEEAAYAGDDLVDLPAMRRAGVGIAVADAHPRVRAEADWVTEIRGGRGALREIAEAILEARGALATAVAALAGVTLEIAGREEER